MGFDFIIVNNFLTIITNLIGLWLVSLVYSTDKKKALNRGFVLFVIINIAWIDFWNLAFFVNQYHLRLLLTRLVYSFVDIWFVVFYYLFIVWFLKEKGWYLLLGKLIIICESILFLLVTFTDFVIVSVDLGKWGVVPTYSTVGAPIYHLIVVALTVFVTGRLIVRYFELPKEEQLKIQYLLIGVIIFVSGNLTFAVFFPFIFAITDYLGMAHYSTIFLLFFTAYAIVKHELMGIKTLLTQVLITIITIILLVDIIFLSNSFAIQLLKAGILVVFLYFSYELVVSIKKEKEARGELETAYEKINQYASELEKTNKNITEKNEDLDALLSLNQISSSGSEINKGLQNILDILPTKFGYTRIVGAALIRYDEKSRSLYAYNTTESVLLKKAKSLLSKPALTDYSSTIGDPENYTLTVETILSNKIQKGEHLEDFITPPVEKHIVQLMQKTMGAEAIIAIPLIIREARLGVLIFLFSKPLDEVTQRDMELVTAFGRQVGMMVENLQYYETLNKNINELTRTKNNLQEILTMKNEFLHIVSHQLRTPLTAVRGLISMWHDGDFDHYTASKMKVIKDRIQSNADRLNNIINDMIVAMESEGELKLVFGPVDAEKMIREVVEMFKANFERRGLYIKFDKIEKGLPMIEADPRNLYHVFMNIVDNAEKYAQKGGLDITLRRDNDNVSVSFADTGIGITAEDQGNLFKKFSRGKKSNNVNPNGSGLGLFIAKQIIDEHHGNIRSSSKGEGKGAVFVVELPIKQPVAKMEK